MWYHSLLMPSMNVDDFSSNNFEESITIKYDRALVINFISSHPVLHNVVHTIMYA